MAEGSASAHRYFVPGDAWSKDGRSAYFMNFQENPAVFRGRMADDAVEQIVDIKDLKYAGTQVCGWEWTRPMPRCFFAISERRTSPPLTWK